MGSLSTAVSSGIDSCGETTPVEGISAIWLDGVETLRLFDGPTDSRRITRGDTIVRVGTAIPLRGDAGRGEVAPRQTINLGEEGGCADWNVGDPDDSREKSGATSRALSA
jgi:hypothetical protein